MIKLSLPGFYVHFKFVKMFLAFYNEHPEYFYKDRIIDSFYDADPNVLWRGGRTPRINEYISMDEILNEFNQYPNIKLRHTFTNCMLTEQLINDYFCNSFVENFIRPQDEVILNNPLLIKHFKTNYPQIPIIYSTTLGITDISRINEITEKNIYVLNYNYNNDNKYIQQLKNKKNVEILCAEPCVINCPYRYKHYQLISEDVLSLRPTEDYNCPFNMESKPFIDIMSLPHAITNNRLKELEQRGFQYFKISGRTNPIPRWLETLVYYLVLPEYKEYVRQLLLDDWW